MVALVITAVTPMLTLVAAVVVVLLLLVVMLNLLVLEAQALVVLELAQAFQGHLSLMLVAVVAVEKLIPAHQITTLVQAVLEVVAMAVKIPTEVTVQQILEAVAVALVGQHLIAEVPAALAS